MRIGILPGLIAVIAVAFTVPTQTQAASGKAVCRVTASAINGKRFAVAKCTSDYKFSDSGVIRSQVWENKDKKAYARLAKLAGRTFTCDAKVDGTRRNSNMDVTYFQFSHCK